MYVELSYINVHFLKRTYLGITSIILEGRCYILLMFTSKTHTVIQPPMLKALITSQLLKKRIET